MGLLIGMDEAGYGPNLGPLVITLTAWQVPDRPQECDLWELFSDVVTDRWRAGETRLHLADSKRVYSPATGISRLEETVLAGLRLVGPQPAGFHDLCERLTGNATESIAAEPCLAAGDLSLPHAQPVPDRIANAAGRWQDCCIEHGIRLVAVRSEIVWPQRWNSLNEQNGNKAATLTRLSLQLLRSVWNPQETEPVLIIADKHGGRNRYDGFLQEIADGEMIFRLREGADVSHYRIAETDIRFQTRGESHLPVALASMICKYIRELSMELFNRFWAEHAPGIKPTKGYPQDAKRFRIDVAEAQQRLGMSDTVLWRER